jgi:hypothetical protein
MRYLLITFMRKPNGQIDEQVAVAKKVKPSDLQTCNVILDYAKKKIDKCVIEGKALEREWDRMHDYYVRIYPNLIAQLEKEASITEKTNGA